MVLEFSETNEVLKNIDIYYGPSKETKFVKRGSSE